jgi:hypothetical protein
LPNQIYQFEFKTDTQVIIMAGFLKPDGGK